MFSTNEKISYGQIKKLLVFDIISISILILPWLAANGAGKDGILAIILGSAAALLYSFFFLYASAKTNCDYLNFSAEAVGGFFTGIFSALYIIKIIASCWFTLRLFAKIITDTLLPDTSNKIIMFTLIIVSTYAAAKGIETLARIAEVFFYIVLIPLILLFILGLIRIEPTNLFPLLTASNSQILYTGYSVLLIYSAFELLMFITPAAASHKRHPYKTITQTVLIITAINILLFILVVGLLGLNAAAHQFKASIMIMQLIQIPGGFVQRQDAVMLAIWMLCSFTILSSYFYHLSKITNSVVKLENQNLFIIFYGVLFFLLSFAPVTLEDLFYYYGIYMAYVGLPQSLCIPLIVILISKIRTRRENTAYEKKSAK